MGRATIIGAIELFNPLGRSKVLKGSAQDFKTSVLI
jgi:hypothetical protein